MDFERSDNDVLWSDDEVASCSAQVPMQKKTPKAIKNNEVKVDTNDSVSESLNI